MITYKGWDNYFDEFISGDSVRIAKHGHFTSRATIPYYKRVTQPSKKVINSLHNSIMGDPLEQIMKERNTKSQLTKAVNSKSKVKESQDE